MKLAARAREVMGASALAPVRRGVGRPLSLAPWQAWARLHNGMVLRVGLSNTIGRSIWMRGSYEPVVEQTIRSLLRPGDSFLDVGANVGYFSLIAAELVGPRGRVVAVEPVPEVASLIGQSASRNEVTNLTVEECAVGAAPGSATMQVQRSSGVSFLGTRADRLPGDAIREERTVRVSTLDELAAKHRLERLRVVKIDVEGREVAALRGGREMLSRQRPALVIEVSDQNLRRFGESEHELAELLRSLGYERSAMEGEAVYDQLWLPRA